MTGRSPIPLAACAAIISMAAFGGGSNSAQGPAAQTDSVTTMYEVNGLKILHHQRTTSDLVAINLYLLGGARQQTPENAGVELFLLSASDTGPGHIRVKRPDALRREREASSEQMVAPTGRSTGSTG